MNDFSVDFAQEYAKQFPMMGFVQPIGSSGLCIIVQSNLRNLKSVFVSAISRQKRRTQNRDVKTNAKKFIIHYSLMAHALATSSGALVATNNLSAT